MSRINFADLDPENKAMAEQIIKDKGWNEELAAVAALAGDGSVEIIEQAMTKPKTQEELEAERDARISHLRAQHKAAKERGDMRQAIGLKNALFAEGVAV